MDNDYCTLNSHSQETDIESDEIKIIVGIVGKCVDNLGGIYISLITNKREVAGK
jgi:hypothetical protein